MVNKGGPGNVTPREKNARLGNVSHRAGPQAVAVLEPAADVPPLPSQLRSKGSEVWRWIWRTASAWVSPETDRATVVRYCELWDLYDDLRLALVENGAVINPDVEPEPSSLIAAYLKVSDQLLKYERVLALTPADRSRMGLVEIKIRAGVEDLQEQRAKRISKRSTSDDAL